MSELKEILLVALPILTGLFTAGAQKWYLNYKTKKFKLIDHPLFTDLEISIRDIDSWAIKENRKVFIDALKIKFEYWKNEGEVLANELQKGNFSDLQLQNKILKWATITVNKYTNKWKEEDIPQLIIDRITTVHEEKVQQFLSEIKQISYASDMYPFKMQKSIAIFDTLRLLLADTKNDFNRLVYREKYNGHFKGVIYKGIPINDAEYTAYITKLKIQK